MMILQVFLFIVEALTSAMLIGVIFLQKSKGAGMGTTFGGAGEAIFGSRMGNVLTKTTVVLAAIFLINTTFLAWLGARQRPTSVMDRAPASAPATLPGGSMPSGDMMSPDMPAGPPMGGEIPMGDMPADAMPVEQPSDATGAALPPPVEPPAGGAVPPVDVQPAVVPVVEPTDADAPAED